MATLYAFYDEGAKFFGPPLMAQNLGMVRRSVRALAQQNADAPFLQYPREFVLYEIAQFDDVSGAIVPVSPPLRLHSVQDLLTEVDRSPADGSAQVSP